MFKKKQIWLAIGLLALTLVLYGCTQLFDFAGLKDVDEQEGLQPLSATSDQFEVVNGKVKVLIGFVYRPGPPEKAIVQGMGGEIRYTYHIVPVIAATIPEVAIAGLKANPNVAYVEADGKVYAIQETLPWGVDRVDAELVHPYNKGTGVKISIIDTGIDYDHPDLDANYKGGVDYVEGDGNPMDDNGHGTHCAGIVAAEDNDIGAVGVAPEAYLYAVKVLDASGSGYVSDVVAGIQWSIDNSMQVTSMSLGTNTDYLSLHDACDAAYAAGILVVAAAGNDGNPPGKGDNIDYPANYDSVIAVAATDTNDKRARWSSTGPAAELSAPGVDIYSTYWDDAYATKSGTSMACPHVTGTAALVMAAYPSWTNVDVRLRLQSTADDLGAAGWDPQYGYGLVDADEAAGQVNDPPTVSITSPTDGSTFDSGATILFEGTAIDKEDGELTASLVWTSSIDGQIGTGGSFSTILSDGNHTITAEVTDSGGKTRSDSIGITVGTPPSEPTRS